MHPSSQDCLRTALTLYGDILTVIERADYDVFSGRASVSLSRKARVAGAGLIRAQAARGHSSPHLSRVPAVGPLPVQDQ